MARTNPIKILRNMGLQICPEVFRPKFARIIVTKNCPLRCKMCTLWRRGWRDPSLKLIKHWISELADFGVEEISIGGGEPFIRKDLTEIVEYIKSNGIECGVTTSGWLTGRVPFPPADHYEISIDGAKPETHDKIRGVKGSWEQAIKTIKLAKERASVSQVNFVLQTDNYLELVEFCKFAKQLGVSVSIIPVSLKLAAQRRISRKMHEVEPAVLKSVINKAMTVGNVLNTREFFDIYFHKVKSKVTRQTCLFPYECILIFADATVYPCGNFDKPVGKLTIKKKLEDIYQSYETLRREVQLGLHKPCWHCTYGDILPHRGPLSNIKFFTQEALRSRPHSLEVGQCSKST